VKKSWSVPLPPILRSWMGQRRKALTFADSVDYGVWQQRFLQQRLQLGLGLAIVAYFTFITLNLLGSVTSSTNPTTNWLGMSVVVEGCLIACLALLKHPIGRRHPALIFLGCAWSVTLVEQVWATLRGVALPGIFAWTLVFLTQATLIPVRWRLHLASQVGVLAYYFGVNWALGLGEPGKPLLDQLSVLYLFWFCLICNLAVFLYERLQKLEFEARQQLRLEQEKSERLLLNILPAAIAHKLKQDSHTIADNFEEVSVLFADIVGFTELSHRISPVELVSLLNYVFSAFDECVEYYGLEKIKTIGDAYMVVGGLPIARPDHAETIAEMALAMQRVMIEFNASHQQAVSLRIGINTGPVVAGVIGIKKFIYDLWGDTVNTASRMESHGIPDCIQVTAETYERLCDRYQFTERGTIQVKGKGEMATYFLIGKKSVASV